MAKFRIVTDSTADIPQSVREKHHIEMVPLKVHFGEETFLDAIDLQSEQFYPKLAEAAALPTTSQPSPVDFLEVYKKILEEDPETHIFSIHLSAALSGTYQSAELAKNLMEGDERLTIIDSRWASYGIGLLVLAAAEAAEKGFSKDEIMERLQAIRDSSKVYFLVDTLEFLQKGGRIGKAAAVLGSLLNIKPILTIDDEGEVASVDKVRGTKRAAQRIIELLKQDYADKDVDIAIVHSNDMAAAESMVKLLQENFRVNKVTYASIGPVIGTHTGPGTVGIFMGPTVE